MHRLGDVGRVEVIVIGIAMPAVALLDPAEEALEHGRRHFELVDHAVAVEQVVAHVLDRDALRRLAQREHVEGPFVESLQFFIKSPFFFPFFPLSQPLLSFIYMHACAALDSHQIFMSSRAREVSAGISRRDIN